MSPLPSALERYLGHLRGERRLAGNTLEAYARDAGLLQELAGERSLERLDSADIRRFVATLHGRGQSPRTLARVLSCWRGFYDWLARGHLVKANPCAGVKAPRAAKRLPEA
ncbi:MAG TPA: site-specific integrase, partial [Usitatibacter sp.]|nr:site-specific integrase [Usitatibacter sp.]